MPSELTIIPNKKEEKKESIEDTYRRAFYNAWNLEESTFDLETINKIYKKIKREREQKQNDITKP